VSEIDYDVAIVGYGPVGQTLAALLGRAGHRVVVFERFAELYDRPRAVHFDHEIMRVWQALGIADEIGEDLLAIPEYRWFGADGEPIMTMVPTRPAPSGWEPNYLFFQPYLEAALDRVAQAHAELYRGWRADDVRVADDHVKLELRRVTDGGVTPSDETRIVRARYVIGADGANSMVREACGIESDDLGFVAQWLTLDLRPHKMSALDYLPTSCQWCDPERPHMHTRNGRGHRRWEFMLLPGERAEEFDDSARVWELLAPWIGPDDAELIRHAVYEFRARLASALDHDRVLLAGDAGHLMPPFMGQGLCAGIRDASNLAWKLDLVLRDELGEQVLHSYTQERRPQLEWIANLSTEMGRVSCVLDPQAAAERDAALRTVDSPPPLALPGLTEGILQSGSAGAPDRPPLAGMFGVQGTVAANGGEGRFDDVVGRGFAVIARRGDPRHALSADQAAFLERIGTRFATLDAALSDSPDAVHDLDGRLTEWLSDHGAEAVIVRPDFYVFGAVSSTDDLPALAEDLRQQLTTKLEATMPEVTPIIRPGFHHINLKTTRLQEMIEWYSTVVGTEVLFEYELGAWLTNDEANHRIALLAFPNFAEDPERETHTGMHHAAFEYGSFDELNDSYLRLRDAGITPAICLDHGMTLSYYYSDPDGNHVELQCDVFGDWAKSSEWMRNSIQFQQDPLGKLVDPERVAADRAAGVGFDEIHKRAMDGGYAPEIAPIELPQAG
jgi:2-polyprenyl-6-methoxyphenol hydroxylase-like FAD-dependent oxidoreductase/catechol 2,3-dioxygenase-like lactoylglutathione lyase family enzyme